MMNMSDVRYKRYYTPRHMWAELTADGKARVGMTAHAVTRLSKPIALLEFSTAVGRGVVNGEDIGIVYAGYKAHRGDSPLYGGTLECRAFDLSAPLSGIVEEINMDMMNDPSAINDDPYGCWILRIKPADIEDELSQLLSPEAYEKRLREATRPSPFRTV